jgi:hypothetical protein
MPVTCLLEGSSTPGPSPGLHGRTPAQYDNRVYKLFWDYEEHTLCERIDSQFPLGILRKILEGDFGLSLPYHKVYDNQALEDNSPCRVTQPVREGSKDLRNAGFTRVGRYQYMFDVLRFRGGKLHVGISREYLWTLAKCDAGVNNERESACAP